jgi:putative addiction module component (TIGR02574 family)
MASKVEEMYEKVMKLSKGERQKLIRLLAKSESGQESKAEVEHLWNEEAARRYRDYKSGKVKAIPADEVFQRLEARFAK